MLFKKTFLSKIAVSFAAIGLLVSYSFPALADSYGLPTDSLKVIIGRVINWLLGISAGLAVLFIIIGGIYYITAAGDESKIEIGKKMITYAIYGLLIVGASYAIVLTVSGFIGG